MLPSTSPSKPKPETGRPIFAGSYVKIYSPSPTRALKVAKRDELIGWWLNEVSVLVSADHANVVKGYSASLTSKSDRVVHSIVMELAAHDMTQLPDDLPFGYRKLLYADILKGLDYCHRKVWVLHRDLKPHNVFIFYGPERLEAKLGDFGNALVLNSPGELVPFIDDVVTYPWRAPEFWGWPFCLEAYGTEVDTYAAIALGLEFLYGSMPPGYLWKALPTKKMVSVMEQSGFPVSQMGLDPTFTREFSGLRFAEVLEDDPPEPELYDFLRQSLRALPCLRPAASTILARVKGLADDVDELYGQLNPDFFERARFCESIVERLETRLASEDADLAEDLVNLATDESLSRDDVDLERSTLLLAKVNYDIFGLRERLASQG